MNLDSISALSIVFPTIVGLFSLGKLNNRALRTLSALIFFTAIMEVTGSIFAAYGWNNMPYFHLFTYIEFALIFLIYYSLLKDLWQRIVLISVALFFGIFSIFNLLYLESILEFNSNQRYVEGFIIMIMCVLFFLNLLRRAEFIKLETYPYFWLTSGFLTYFAGTLIVFYLVKRLEDDSADFYWGVHGILNILLNVCYAMTLWMGRRVSIA